MHIASFMFDGRATYGLAEPDGTCRPAPAAVTGRDGLIYCAAMGPVSGPANKRQQTP